MVLSGRRDTVTVSEKSGLSQMLNFPWIEGLSSLHFQLKFANNRESCTSHQNTACFRGPPSHTTIHVKEGAATELLELTYQCANPSPLSEDLKNPHKEGSEMARLKNIVR